MQPVALGCLLLMALAAVIVAAVSFGVSELPVRHALSLLVSPVTGSMIQPLKRAAQ